LKYKKKKIEGITRIEEKIGTSLPKSYNEFLLLENTDIYKYKSFSRLLKNGYKKIIQIDEVMTIENFLENNKYLDFIVEFQEDDELPSSYVEGKFLYQIMNCDSKSVYLSMDGLHKGKVYVVDNGDYGITFQSNTLEEFLNSIFDLNKMKCTVVVRPPIIPTKNYKSYKNKFRVPIFVIARVDRR